MKLLSLDIYPLYVDEKNHVFFFLLPTSKFRISKGTRKRTRRNYFQRVYRIFSKLDGRTCLLRGVRSNVNFFNNAHVTLRRIPCLQRNGKKEARMNIYFDGEQGKEETIFYRDDRSAREVEEFLAICCSK